MLQYVLTGETLCVYGGKGDGVSYVEVGRDHPNFAKIANLLETGTFEEVSELACITKAINAVSDGKIVVDDCGVYYNGEPIHNSVVDAIFDYQRMSLPIGPIVKFLENLMKNPSKNSVEQLWRFIEHHKLPLTEDGCLLAYKAVRSDYKDKFSGRIDNSIGSVIKMDRNKISDDANYHCAAGLHVGGLKYSGPEGWYSSNGDICVIVKVNPMNVVCVPHDHDATKVRVCEYEVVKPYCQILKSTCYDSNYDEFESDEWDDEEFTGEENIVVGSIVRWHIGDVVGEVLTEPDHTFDRVVVRELVSRRLYEVDIDELELEE